MTKKHFTAIAATIREEIESHDASTPYSAGQRDAAQRLAVALATDFASFNNNFDRQRFLTACGL